MFKSIISLLCLAGAIALFFLYTKPTYDSLQVLQRQIIEYDKALEKAAELQRLKQSLLSRYNAFSPADIDRLHKLLPDHVDNVRLVLDLDTLASKHGLALQNVAVSPPPQTTDAQVIGPATSQFDSISLKFSTTGKYDEFVSFLTDLEKSLRVVDVRTLKLAETGAVGIYRFDIDLQTYWLK